MVLLKCMFETYVNNKLFAIVVSGQFLELFGLKYVNAVFWEYCL